MKKHLLLTTLTALLLSYNNYAQTTLDEWTFTSATPQTSDILSKSMGNWDPSLAGNSVPSPGLLRDATGGNSTAAWYGDHLGLGSMPDNVVITVDIADINHADRDYWFEFLGTVGGNTRLDIDAFNGGISIDVWGAGTELSVPGKIFDVDDYTGAISMQVIAKWDFTNGTLSYSISGDGVGYSGSGSSAFSDTQSMSADLSGITNLKQIRVRGNTVASGEYIDLDKVTISYNSSVLSRSTFAHNDTKVWYSKENNTLHLDGEIVNSVTIYSLTGSEISKYNNPSNAIVLDDLSSGIYIVKVATENGLSATKIIL